ncbi:MAG TPA: hypothetical protein VMI31_01315 [Fimbriimonadaceae bacterium]|nr:hypothetical protein [Fimbriimonadaceae bacterium]
MIGIALIGFGYLAFHVLRTPDVLVPSGTELMSDDFGVSPLSAIRKGDQIVLRLRVTNHALRVPFTFEPWMVTLTDERGQPLQLLTADGSQADSLDHGESTVRELAFASVDSRGPYVLRFAVSGTMGDVLNRLFGEMKHESVEAR